MTDKHTVAAQCWALIEEKLTGILADDRLDQVRAECIRIIADAIDGKKLRARRTPKERPMPVLPVQPVQAPPIVDSMPVRQATRRAALRRSIDQAALTTRLEQLLQQSTMGYSGDDEVGYG